MISRWMLTCISQLFGRTCQPVDDLRVVVGRARRHLAEQRVADRRRTHCPGTLAVGRRIGQIAVVERVVGAAWSRRPACPRARDRS